MRWWSARRPHSRGRWFLCWRDSVSRLELINSAVRAFFSITYEDFGIVLKGNDGSEYIASFPTDRASSKKIKVYKRTGELTTDIYSV